METQHDSGCAQRPATLTGAQFQEASDALLVVDPTTERVLDANAMAERLSEFSRDELIHLSLRSLFRHEQPRQDGAGGPNTPLPRSEKFLLRTRQPDRWVPVSVLFSRLPMPDGNALALCRLRDLRPPTNAPKQGSGTILLGEDDRAVMDVVSRMLGSLGCRVVTASTGEEVLQRYREHVDCIRIVLLDLSMPRMSGEQVLAELRRLSADLPVVIMSGHAEQDIVSRLSPLGLTGYLQKPFRLPALLAAVQPHLGARRSA
jgi:CheY-like chemotaxis protein